MNDGSMMDVSSLANWSVGDSAVLLANSANDIRGVGMGVSLSASTTFNVTALSSGGAMITATPRV